MFSSKKISSALPLFLMISLSLNSLSNNTFITPHTEWALCSPVLTQTTRTINSPITHTVESLYSLGQQADQAWSDISDAQQRIQIFHEIFSSVDTVSLNHIIDQILSSEPLLEKVTRASYRNVTGFLKVVLAQGSDKDSWKIRLHVWEQKAEKEFPHNHKWDFYSKIISGYLSQDLYLQTKNCNSITPYSVREPVSLMPIPENGELPCPCRDNYVLNPKTSNAESVSLSIHETNIIAAGESYVMPHHLVHSITPGRNAISLVFTSRKISENSEVFVPMDQVETDLTRNAPSITTEELKQELLRIKSMLNQLHIQKHYLPEMVNPSHPYYNVNNDDTILKGSNWRQQFDTTHSGKRVIQLSTTEMQQYKITADNQGNALINGTLLNNSHDYLFVLFDQTMYAVPKDFHHKSDELLCHTSFTDYGPVDSVGILQFDAYGTLTTIEAYSGHYMPSVEHMAIAKKHLDTIGINTRNAKMIGYQNRLLTN